MREFKYDFVGDPAVFQDRRQPPHSDHRYLLPGGASPRLSLNGSWYFHYAENWAGAPEGFFEEDRDCRGWDVIGVPGHIQLAGYGRPQYVNIQYPWDGREAVEPGEAPEACSAVGSYVKYVRLPAYMEGMRVFISFQGAESGLAVW